MSKGKQIILSKGADTAALAEQSQVLFQEVAKEAAEKLLTTYAYARQRNIQEPRIQYLAFQHWKQQLIGKIIYIVLATLPDGKRFLINGYHTLNAIIRTGIPLAVNVQNIQAKNMEEIDDLYAKYDTNKGRTAHDALRAYGIDTHFSASEENVAMAAVKLMLNGFRSTEAMTAARRNVLSDRQILATAYDYYLPYLLIFFEQYRKVEKEYRSVFLNSGVIGSSILTTQFAQERATAFWDGVMMPDMLPATNPAFVLHRMMTVMAVRRAKEDNGRRSRTMQSKKERLSPTGTAHQIAFAWNAFIEGRSLSNIQTPMDKALRRPLYFRETPYDGKSYVQPSIPDLDLTAEFEWKLPESSD
jgi:hypothetical protein